MRNLYNLKSLSLDDILSILKRASEFKAGAVADFSGKIIANLFFEPSTRTQNSFIMAEKKLHMQDINLNPVVSSLQKGESLYDTVKTFAAIGVDAVVIRATENEYYKQFENKLQIPLINGGDGSGDHPTQSLLDLMTIQEEFGVFLGKKCLIVGDISHSRVANTNIEIMKRLGMEVYLAAPSVFQNQNYSYVDFDEVIGDMDVVMLLRVQHERHAEKYHTTSERYLQKYGLSKERNAKMKKDAIIMHPAPFNRGWEIDGDLCEGGKSRIFEQMSNGVFVRMAVLEYCLSGE
ncbi:aspartate carbamoyltransferase catalytic subunit [Clostridiales bacterium COT073_COT-073]|nr:aspartate carbamoyltransferase catalytic subunit [Clostridiales bacterium COT073_COT-073]